MTRINKSSISFMALTVALAPIPGWGAQPQSAAGAAPVPAPIVSAKRVFISNAGGRCDPSTSAYFKGGPNRAYNQFTAALKGWGRYELVAAPADAELALEITFSCPLEEGTKVLSGARGAPSFDPQLRLAILDVKTHITLWGITEHVAMALLQSNRE